MGNRICNQESGGHPEKKQDAKTHNKGEVGARSVNLVKLIGAERVSRREFQYEGTYYVTKYGETYDKKYVDTYKPTRTGVNFYEVSNWIYNEKKQLYEPIVRRIVMIKIKDTQLSLDL